MDGAFPLSATAHQSLPKMYYFGTLLSRSQVPLCVINLMFSFLGILIQNPAGVAVKCLL